MVLEASHGLGFTPVSHQLLQQGLNLVAGAINPLLKCHVAHYLPPIACEREPKV